MPRHKLIDISMSGDRPKCTELLSVKLPEELLSDLRAFGQRHHPAKSIGDVIKDCCEFRLTMIKGLRVGYYQLRSIPDLGEAVSGTTK